MIKKLAYCLGFAALSSVAWAGKLGEGLVYYYDFNTNTAATTQKWDTTTEALVAGDTTQNFPFAAGANFGTVDPRGKTGFGNAMSGGNNGTRVYAKSAPWLVPTTDSSKGWTIALWALRAASTANKPSVIMANGPLASTATGGVTTTSTFTTAPAENTNVGWGIYYSSSTAASGTNGTGTPIFRFSTTTDGTTFAFHAITSEVTFAEGEAQTNWTHFAVTLTRGEESDTVKLYVNGVLGGSTTVTKGSYIVVPEANTSTKVGLFMNTSDGGQGQQNAQDDVAIWERALSATEIDTLVLSTGDRTTAQPLGTLATVEVGGQEVEAAVTADSNWTELPWTPAVTTWDSGISFATLTATNTEATTVTMDQSITLGRALKVVGAGELTLALGAGAEGVVPTISTPAYDFSGATGKTTVAFATETAAVTAGSDTLLTETGSGSLTIPSEKKATLSKAWTGTVSNTGTLEYDYAENTVASMANGTTVYTMGTADGEEGDLNPINGGVLEIKKGTYNLATMDFSGTQTTLQLDDGVLNFTHAVDGAEINHGFSLGMVNFVMNGGTITTPRFTLSQGANWRTANVTQNGGDITVTGETSIDENTTSIMFGHWSGATTYKLNGGTFSAPKAYVLVGKTANNHTWVIGPETVPETTQAVATANVKGIRYSTGATGTNALTVRKGGALVLGDSGLDRNGKTLTFKVDGVIRANATAVTVNAPMTTYLGATLDVPNAEQTLTMSGAISNALEATTPKLTKTGSGKLVLSGNNTFTGGMEITAGSVSTTTAALGTGVVTVAAGTMLQVKLTADQMVTGYTVSTVTLADDTATFEFLDPEGTKIEEGVDGTTYTPPLNTWTAGADANWSTATNWSKGEVPTEGVVVVKGGDEGSTLTLDVAIPEAITGISVVGSVTMVTSEAQATLPTSLTLTEGAELTTSADFAGAWTQPVGTTITFDNATITTASTYNGTVNIKGTTTLATAALGIKGTLNVLSGATLVTATADSPNYNGSCTIHVAGTLDMSNKRWSFNTNNTLSLTQGAQIIGTGDEHGAFDFFASNTITVTAQADATQTTTIAAPIRLRSSGNIVTVAVPENVTVALTGNILAAKSAGGLTKTGAGTLSLSGTKTYSGATTISAGTVILDKVTAFGTGAVSIALGAKLSSNASTLTIAGVISGAGNLEVLGSGALTLTGANTATGSLILDSGVTVNLTNTNTWAIAVDKPFTLPSDAILDVSSANAKLFSTASYGNGIMTIQGTLKTRDWDYGKSLGNLRTNSDAIVLDGGTVEFLSTMSCDRGFKTTTQGGTLKAPYNVTFEKKSGNSNGQLSFAGNLTLSGTGTFKFTDTKASTGAGAIKVSQGAIIGGTQTLAKVAFDSGAWIDATANGTTNALMVTSITWPTDDDEVVFVKVPEAVEENTLLLKTNATATQDKADMLLLFLGTSQDSSSTVFAFTEGNNYVAKTVNTPTNIPEGTSEGAQEVLREIMAVNGVTDATVSGTTVGGSETLTADQLSGALELFGNIETVTPAEGDTPANIDISYDFGISDVKVDAEDSSMVAVTVKVQNKAAEPATIIGGNTVVLAADDVEMDAKNIQEDTDEPIVLKLPIESVNGKKLTVKVRSGVINN